MVKSRGLFHYDEEIYQADKKPVFYIRLADYTVVQHAGLSPCLDRTVDMGEYYYQIAQERKKIEVTLRGVRGNILDRNGIPLAVNRQIYVAQVDRRWLPANGVQINEILSTFGNRFELNRA